MRREDGMRIHHGDDRVTIWHGTALDVMRTMADESVDAVVTDPPYGLSNTDPAHVVESLTHWLAGDREFVPRVRGGGFMGAAWDEFVPPPAAWDECLRVLKPGGHLLVFAGPRTMDLMGLSIRLAGFDIRDGIAWLFGSGFPKSLDVSKAIDKRRDWSLVERLSGEIRRARAETGLSLAEIGQATLDATDGTYGKWYHRGGHMFFETGRSLPSRPEWEHLRHVLPIAPEFVEVYDEAEREITGHHDAGNPIGLYEHKHGEGNGRTAKERRDIPATPDAERWQGWGTALKPSHEPVVVARKPAGPTAILDTIGSQLGALEEACRRRVSGAARSSAPTPADSSAARTATAPESAATQHEAGQEPTTATGAAGGLSAATGTSASEWTGERFLSTVTSWRECWAEIYEATSMSTTSTGTSRTTDLQTLSSCLSSIMQSVTAQSTLDPRSWSSLATAADNLFAAGVLSSRSTLALSAIESATSATQQDSPPAVGSGAAFEPVVVARKPLSGTVAANVLQHGTGALNVDACRVGDEERTNPSGFIASGSGNYIGGPRDRHRPATTVAGRWPTNVVLDDSQAAELDEQSAVTTSQGGSRGQGGGKGAYGVIPAQPDVEPGYGDTGGASRFFPTFRYEAKAPATERPRVNGTAHPTVKPLDLMRWLVRLVTPPGGTVLEPFAGSGTTVEACIVEGFHCIAIEREADYLPLIMQRVNRRRDPVAYMRSAGDDLGLFELDGEGA